MMVHSLWMLATGLCSRLRAVFGRRHWLRVGFVVLLSCEHSLLLLLYILRGASANTLCEVNRCHLLLIHGVGTASTVLVVHLRWTVRVHIILLEAIILVMLQEKGLLYHCLIWLGEEVVLLDIILVGRHHLCQITLQEAVFPVLLRLLRRSYRLLLLLVLL